MITPKEWKYRHDTAGPLNAAGDALFEQIRASNADEDLQRLVQECMNSCGGSLITFGWSMSKQRGPDEREAEMRAFANGLKSPERAAAVLRAGTWAYFARLSAVNWPDRYEEAILAAEKVLGAATPVEATVARFGPLLAEQNPGAEFARFSRITLEALVHAATGVPSQGGDLGFVQWWAMTFVSGWILFDAEVEIAKQHGRDPRWWDLPPMETTDGEAFDAMMSITRQVILERTGNDVGEHTYA